jgi:ferredoxin-NADP reductase
MLRETIWPAADHPLAFACGPTALVETVATYLLSLGYDRERIKTERFGPTGDENHL